MRLAAALVFAALGCATPGQPTGGPEDIDPPQIVRIRPDTNALGVRDGSIGVDFDEVISERPQGAASLADLFLISPSTGEHSISWKRTRVEVTPKGGLRPNTTYSVTMLPGMVDLDGNADSTGLSFVFSTGASIATGEIRGVVFDWRADKSAPKAYVELIALPDSIRYFAFADSTGTYHLRNLPQGEFLLRGSIDQNNNRRLDARELHDTTSVTLNDSLVRDLYAIVRDTLGPGIDQVTLVDSLHLGIRFDRVLDTAQVVQSSQISLQSTDSTRVEFAAVTGGAAFKVQQEEARRQRAVADSIRADSVAKADTTTPPADTTQPPPRPAPRATPPAPAAADTAGRDSTPPLPKPAFPPPDNEVVITLREPLPANTRFIVRATDIVGILKRSRTSQRLFTTPRARPAADSTRGRPTATDTTRRAPVRPDTLAQLSAAPSWRERASGTQQRSPVPVHASTSFIRREE